LSVDLPESLGYRVKRVHETGLIYLGVRMYEPVSGIFLSTDPLGHSASQDLYSFCGGDPINSFDPDGRCGGRAVGWLERWVTGSDEPEYGGIPSESQVVAAAADSTWNAIIAYAQSSGGIPGTTEQMQEDLHSPFRKLVPYDSAAPVVANVSLAAPGVADLFSSGGDFLSSLAESTTARLSLPSRGSVAPSSASAAWQEFLPQAQAKIADVNAEYGGVEAYATASRTRWGPEHGRGNVLHNNAIEDELDAAYARGATDLRKNRVQRDAAGNRVFAPGGSFTKPDAAWIENGVRHNFNRVSSLDDLEREIQAYIIMIGADPNAVSSMVF